MGQRFRTRSVSPLELSEGALRSALVSFPYNMTPKLAKRGHGYVLELVLRYAPHQYHSAAVYLTTLVYFFIDAPYESLPLLKFQYKRISYKLYFGA